MTRTLLLVFVFSAAFGCAAAAAQEPPQVPPATPPPVSAPPAAQPPVTPPPVAQPPASQPPAAQPPPAAAPLPPLDEAALRRRRSQIQIMEGVLARAVRSAAQEIASELRTPETGEFLMTGSLSARGFNLDDYGVFFHVEIPGVKPSLISPAVLEALRERLAQQAGRAKPETASSGGGAAAQAPPNADAEYVARIKEALMQAMIDYSKPLELRPDEWFTVAAGDGDEPFMPAVLAEQHVMVLRIRGRDIADYMAGRLTREEVRKKVEIRKF